MPHRTAPEIDAPWAPPGTYSVRLTVDGQVQSQPLVLLLDPRVKHTAEVEQIFVLTRQIEEAARNAARARSEIQTAMAKSTGSRDLREKLLELAPASDGKTSENEGAETSGGRAASLPSAATLTNISGRLVTSVMGMQGSEMPPTQSQLAGCRRQLSAYSALMARWSALRAQLP